jgi:ABC-type tungstate transport system substrate-binding protein
MKEDTILKIIILIIAVAMYAVPAVVTRGQGNRFFKNLRRAYIVFAGLILGTLLYLLFTQT